ncbi:MAG: DcaP family trimeric outer membrane transporter [Bacteroidota bacterium]
MKQIVSMAFMLIFTVGSVMAQNKPGWLDSISVNPYGYVKLDAFYDTRETVSGREGHFLLWPAPPSYDLEGNDLNDKSSFNMLAVQSNFGLKVEGPQVLNSKTSACIEADFFGQKNDNINLLRLRHAYIKMTWSSTEILAGQFWNPVFNLEAFPYTVSFTTGTPVLPFSRNPQIRLTQHFRQFTVMGIIQSQRDYPSYGPDPDNPVESIPSPQFLSNAGLPECHLKLGWKTTHNNLMYKSGIGVGYKEIMPRTVTSANIKTTTTVPGYSATGYLSIGNEKCRFAAGAVYGNNATDVMSPGGFAVSAVKDSVSDFVEYTTLSSGSLWTDVSCQINNIHLGVFSGYLKHFGAGETITGHTWGIANNMAYMYRIAPRIWYQKKHIRLSFEIEHTAAAFGTPDEQGMVQDAEEVANTRFLLGFYCFFNQHK